MIQEEEEAQEQDQPEESGDEEIDDYNTDPSSQYIITNAENESEEQNPGVETEYGGIWRFFC